MSTQPLLVIQGLAASVAGTAVLRGIDLTVNAGEVHAIMGPNGSGKSTLAHVLAGRPGYEITGGTVRYRGADLLALAHFHTFKQEVLVTRCSNNYGPYQFPEKLIPLMITNALGDIPLPV